jgi:hypothetical protein
MYFLANSTTLVLSSDDDSDDDPVDDELADETAVFVFDAADVEDAAVDFCFILK